ncbi:hypothetical protein H1C71_024743 [Ictidomys tridecemlineatus]|nr:hypothetical protein H1C71_024743 [Ictidomys tridecemlineatus]
MGTSVSRVMAQTFSVTPKHSPSPVQPHPRKFSLPSGPHLCSPVLGMEARASHVLGKCSTTEPRSTLDPVAVICFLHSPQSSGGVEGPSANPEGGESHVISTGKGLGVTVLQVDKTSFCNYPSCQKSFPESGSREGHDIAVGLSEDVILREDE